MLYVIIWGTLFLGGLCLTAFALGWTAKKQTGRGWVGVLAGIASLPVIAFLVLGGIGAEETRTCRVTLVGETAADPHGPFPDNGERRLISFAVEDDEKSQIAVVRSLLPAPLPPAGTAYDVRYTVIRDFGTVRGYRFDAFDGRSANGLIMGSLSDRMVK